MSTDEGFFSRWSRRKAQVRSGDALPESAPAPAPAPAEASPSAPRSSAPPRAGTPAAGAGPAVAAPAAPAVAAPAPTLDDVRQLTIESDFRPFVDRQVAPEVRNAAFRKLFSDPHFNVMDGLDVYIDDYSKPDPLPVEMARRMVAAQFMKIFDEPKREEAPVGDTPAAPAPVADAARSPGAAPDAAAATVAALPEPSDPAPLDASLPAAAEAVPVPPPTSRPT